LDTLALINALSLNGGYLTTLVSLSVAFLGAVSGVVGTFAMIRKIAMLSDVVSHASIPGTAIAFILATLIGLTPILPLLAIGALLLAAIAAFIVQKLITIPTISEDIALASTVGGFFGAGTLLISIIQSLNFSTNSINISDFILGSPSRMSLNDTLYVFSVLSIVLIIALAKKNQFIDTSFDPENAQLKGLNTQKIDQILIFLLLLTTIAGMLSIGIILMIALITIPPITARLWSFNISTITIVSAIIGASSGFIGVALSASVNNLPTGSTVVLIAASFLICSLFSAPQSPLSLIPKNSRHLRHRPTIQ
jgi:manganese/zinc/iron transport system permease protein